MFAGKNTIGLLYAAKKRGVEAYGEFATIHKEIST